MLRTAFVSVTSLVLLAELAQSVALQTVVENASEEQAVNNGEMTSCLELAGRGRVKVTKDDWKLFAKELDDGSFYINVHGNTNVPAEKGSLAWGNRFLKNGFYSIIGKVP